VERNRPELEANGYRVLRGVELREFNSLRRARGAAAKAGAVAVWPPAPCSRVPN